jgi:hypothetical protein
MFKGRIFFLILLRFRYEMFIYTWFASSLQQRIEPSLKA